MDYLEITELILFALSILWVHGWLIIKGATRDDLSRILFLDALALTVVLIGYFQPKLYSAVMVEDYIGEWITFYAFALAGIVALAYLWHHREDLKPSLSPGFLFPLTVAAFCLFVAGEEASWGQRILAFRPPDLFLERNYQQELNVHNLFKGDGFLGIQIESKDLVMLICFLYGILLPLATRFIPTLQRLERYSPRLCLAPYFMLIIATEEIYPISLTGEGCEMYLGIVFLTHVTTAYPVTGRSSSRWRHAFGLPALIAVTFLLGAITAPMLNVVVYRADAEAVDRATVDLRLLQADFMNPDTDKKKILRKRRVHKRIYTAIQQDYFDLSEGSLFLKSRSVRSDENTPDGGETYYLDPWNNPYWVYYKRSKRTAILYSFGPNRKRDSDLRRELGLAGDDVGVVFRVR